MSLRVLQVDRVGTAVKDLEMISKELETWEEWNEYSERHRMPGKGSDHQSYKNRESDGVFYRRGQ